MKRIISFFFSIAIAISLSSPAFAVESSSIATGTFWDLVGMYCMSYGDAAGGYQGAFMNFLGTLISDEVCDGSPDNLHHGNVSSIVGGSRNGTMLAKCKCDYCRREFTVRLSSSDLSTAYNDYVQMLPSTDYMSNGHLLWMPHVEDVYRSYYASFYKAEHTMGDPAGLNFVSELNDGTGYYFNIGGNGNVFTPEYGYGFACSYALPVSGSYARCNSSRTIGEFFYAGGSSVSLSENYNSDSVFSRYEAGTVLRSNAATDRFFEDALIYDFVHFLQDRKIALPSRICGMAELFSWTGNAIVKRSADPGSLNYTRSTGNSTPVSSWSGGVLSGSPK